MGALVKLAFVLSVIAAVNAMVIQEVAMTEEEEKALIQLLKADLASQSRNDMMEVFLERRASVSGDCNTQGNSATCCGRLSFRVFFKTYNFEICLYAEYFPDTLGVHLKLTVQGTSIINQKFSVHDPPTLCVSAPSPFTVLGSICIKLSNLDVVDGQFHGCMKMEAGSLIPDLFSVDFGCITLG